MLFRSLSLLTVGKVPCEPAYASTVTSFPAKRSAGGGGLSVLPRRAVVVRSLEFKATDPEMLTERPAFSPPLFLAERANAPLRLVASVLLTAVRVVSVATVGAVKSAGAQTAKAWSRRKDRAASPEMAYLFWLSPASAIGACVRVTATFRRRTS